MAKSSDNPTTQTNLALDSGVARQFEAFCSARGMSKAHVASAAILGFLERPIDERDEILVRLSRWIENGERDLNRPSTPGEAAARKAVTDAQQSGQNPRKTRRTGA